ncbi:MAG: DNA gyrase subunit A [Candidatus Methanomethylophilaceae archaeon]|nr:DNA gyrase subunit A [Candidatus Methanomethylophilaceae archaeon]
MSDEEIIIKEPKLVTQCIEKMMSSSYIDYSMSVIIGRALPDARDGLKPVHRRILYAMNDLGVSYRSAHKKSARIVGEVLGKYHPHGDSAAYEAMVRLAQPFSLRYPLVDGQGNFGSVDGDSAAAMRYTEARLSRMASDLLADIDKDTVDMVRNFDESLWEPSVLPSKFPNLLLNGSSGIAVGMATNMPPHNFREVVDAIVYYIDNPDADVYQLMDYIKGPDFPTGGTIHGISGIVSAYSTGRGRIRVRSKTHFETLHSGKVAIVVTEIPYQVNKSKLVAEIAERVKNKEIEGITDLRDESDRDGMRIVIELHKDAIEEVVLENLFKFTQMQVTFGIINLALVNGKPQILTLQQMIEQYVLHRKDVVTRRTKFELAEAEKKEHILEAYMAAFNMLDETIEVIRNSKDTDAANIALQELLSIDDIQAKAILDLKLQKLTGLEIDSLRQEYDENTRFIADCKDILAHEGRILAIIKDELNEMKEAYGDDRRTEIDVNDIDVDEEDLIPEEDVVVTITEDNYIKRIPLRTYRQQGRGGVGLVGMQTKEEDTVINMFVTSSHNYVMFVTNTGRLLWLKGYRIPEGGRQSKGKPIVNILSDLQEGEKVLSVIYTKEFTDDQYILFCTKNGLIKKTPLSAYGNVRQKGIKAIKLDDGDELVETRIVDGDEFVMIATKDGLAARFPCEEVRATGRDTMGVKGITLNDGDVVVSMAVVREGDMLLTVSENGFGKISYVDDYRLTHRGSKGVITIKTTDRNGCVVAVKKVSEDKELIVTSEAGKMLRIRIADIRVTGRNAAGVKIMDLRDGDKVVALQPVDSAEVEEDPEAPVTEAADGSPSEE